jgi:hypothetical protein
LSYSRSAAVKLAQAAPPTCISRINIRKRFSLSCTDGENHQFVEEAQQFLHKAEELITGVTQISF